MREWSGVESEYIHVRAHHSVSASYLVIPLGCRPPSPLLLEEARLSVPLFTSPLTRVSLLLVVCTVGVVLLFHFFFPGGFPWAGLNQFFAERVLCEVYKRIGRTHTPFFSPADSPIRVNCATYPLTRMQFKFHMIKTCQRLWGRKLRTIVLFVLLIVPAIAFASEAEKCSSGGHGAVEDPNNPCSELIPLSAGNLGEEPPDTLVTIPADYGFRYTDVTVTYKVDPPFFPPPSALVTPPFLLWNGCDSRVTAWDDCANERVG